MGLKTSHIEQEQIKDKQLDIENILGKMQLQVTSIDDACELLNKRKLEASIFKK